MDGPDTPAGALALATEAQGRCTHAEAERWGLHAAVLGQQQADVRAMVMGWKVAGDAANHQAAHGRAVKHFYKAYSITRGKPEVSELLPVLAHHLFVANGHAGHLDYARRWQKRAQELIPAESAAGAALSADGAWFRIEAGDFGTAATFLPALTERVTVPAQRVLLLGNLAVAQSAAGMRADAVCTVATVHELLDVQAAGCDSWGYFALGWAYANLGEVRRAKDTVSMARRLAARNGEEFVRSRAAALLRRLG